MAEDSSISVQDKSIISSSDDSLIDKDKGETIDCLLGLTREGKNDNQQAPDGETLVVEFADGHNPMEILENYLKIEVFGDRAHGPVENLENSSGIKVFDDKEKEIAGVVENSERNGNKRYEKKETDGKKAKRPRKRGKGPKRYSDESGNGVEVFQGQCVCDCEKRGDRARVVYHREDVEALRYVDLEGQKKKWIEVYCRFGPVVAKEYDGLVADGCREEGNYVNFDPRQQFIKEKVAADVLGIESDNLGSETENMNHLNPASGINGSHVDGCSDVVEDHSEENDSDEEYVSIQRPAFLVTGEPDFDSGPPQDGLEYLRRVRWEAEHIPKVKIAKLDRSKLNKEQTVYMPTIPDIADCPEHLMPSKEWEDVFVADFSELRLSLSHEEGANFSGGCGSVHVNDEFSLSILESVHENLDDSSSDRVDSSRQSDGHPTIQSLSSVDEVDASRSSASTPKSSATSDDWPSLPTILGMEPVARVSMLRRRIKSVETMSSISKNDCAWLFALCAAIDTPLDADTSASLRCLLRKCASLRAEKEIMDDEVIMLNILATISGKYFGQSEI